MNITLQNTIIRTVFQCLCCLKKYKYLVKTENLGFINYVNRFLGSGKYYVHSFEDGKFLQHLLKKNLPLMRFFLNFVYSTKLNTNN